MLVFDANAMIAYVRNELGAEEVEKLLLTTPNKYQQIICRVAYRIE